MPFFRLTGLLPTVLLITAYFWGLPACGGGGGSDGDEEVDAGTGSGDVAADISSTLDTVSSVVSTSLNVSSSSLLVKAEGEFIKTASVDQHVHCDTGGPALVTGTIDGSSSEGTFDLAVDFNDCSGSDGDVSYDGSYATPGETVDFDVAFTGSVGGNGCLLTLDAAGYSFSVTPDTIAAPVSETFSGSPTGTCSEPGGQASISCEFAEGIDPDDEAAIEAACNCSGDGCGN